MYLACRGLRQAFIARSAAQATSGRSSVLPCLRCALRTSSAAYSNQRNHRIQNEAAGRQRTWFPPPSTATLQDHLKTAHYWKMVEVYGQPVAQPPPSAAHLFFSCGIIETIFLMINMTTFSPLTFEMFLRYHLKYTALVISFWGGTYWGLTIARQGPFPGRAWMGVRTTVGVLLMLTGVTSLVLADNLGNKGVWMCYWVLIGAYSGMAAFDLFLHNQHLIPPWLLKYKGFVSVVIILSLVFGVFKGKYLEKNAMALIMEAASGDPL